ncbi:MAG: hypothetical protein DRP30_02580 [Thermotoga sp.]|nr:MAG: hypothetical protein DRP30_02580 [Thermotoga sp.]
MWGRLIKIFLDIVKTIHMEFSSLKVFSMDLSVNPEVEEITTPSSEPLEVDLNVKLNIEEFAGFTEHELEVSEIDLCELRSLDQRDLDFQKLKPKLMEENMEIHVVVSDVKFPRTSKIEPLDSDVILDSPIVRYSKFSIPPRLKLRFMKFLSLLNLNMDDVEIVGYFEGVPVKNIKMMKVGNGKLFIHLDGFGPMKTVDLIMAKVVEDGRIVFMPTEFGEIEDKGSI